MDSHSETTRKTTPRIEDEMKSSKKSRLNLDLNPKFPFPACQAVENLPRAHHRSGPRVMPLELTLVSPVAMGHHSPLCTPIKCHIPPVVPAAILQRLFHFCRRPRRLFLRLTWKSLCNPCLPLSHPRRSLLRTFSLETCHLARPH
jgi:hypothetical protein